MTKSDDNRSAHRVTLIYTHAFMGNGVYFQFRVGFGASDMEVLAASGSAPRNLFRFLCLGYTM